LSKCKRFVSFSSKKRAITPFLLHELEELPMDHAVDHIFDY